MKPESALRFWGQLRDDGTELAHMLRQYPSVKYQPLETLYAVCRAAVTLDEKLVFDLTTHYTWRGVVYASFLAALRPLPCYASYLQLARDRVPHNQWIVDLALNEILGTSSELHPTHQKTLVDLRGHVEIFPGQVTKLRRTPTQEELLRLRVVTAEVADAYKKGGATKARAALDASDWRAFH